MFLLLLGALVEFTFLSGNITDIFCNPNNTTLYDRNKFPDLVSVRYTHPSRSDDARCNFPPYDHTATNPNKGNISCDCCQIYHCPIPAITAHEISEDFSCRSSRMDRLTRRILECLDRPETPFDGQQLFDWDYPGGIGKFNKSGNIAFQWVSCLLWHFSSSTPTDSQ